MAVYWYGFAALPELHDAQVRGPSVHVPDERQFLLRVLVGMAVRLTRLTGQLRFVVCATQREQSGSQVSLLFGLCPTCIVALQGKNSFQRGNGFTRSIEI